jgi:hypothetical protein
MDSHELSLLLSDLLTPIRTFFIGEGDFSELARPARTIITHQFFGYQLLDTFLWANDWPTHPALSFKPRRTPSPHIPKTLKTVIRKLKNWPEGLREWDSVYRKSASVNSSTQQPLFVLPSEGSTSAALVSRTTTSTTIDTLATAPFSTLHKRSPLYHLQCAFWHNKRMRAQNVLYHVNAAAFLMHSFKPVSG